jgi:phage tail-like protein
MGTAALLPPIPKPPHDPTWWLLSERVGWRAAKLEHAEIAPGSGQLVLARVPGSGPLLPGVAGTFGGLVPPGNTAIGPDGSIYLLDTGGGILKRFDPCECAFAPVPCSGGIGKGARQFLDPHGIGLCGGNLYVCDTGNGRVSIFALHGFALRGFLAPPASAGLLNPWQPYGIAFDGRGRIFVSDAANACIHRFDASGRWQTLLAGFGAISWIAIDCEDRLYAVAQDEPGVRIVDTNGKSIGTALRPDELSGRFPVLSFTIDSAGKLELGSLCAQGGAPLMFNGKGEPAGPPLPPPPVAYFKLGTYWSEPLDSHLYRCQWHRIVLRGAIPKATRVQVSTFTAEAHQPFSLISSLPASAWQTHQTATRMEGGEWDCLVASGGGRYLWLRLTLQGNGSATPAIESARVEFPRISLRRYLPAVFAEDPTGADFTDRFLCVFDTTLRSIERQVDYEAALFDPLSTPARPDPKTGVDFLSWLASWVGITLDRQWPEWKRRQFLKRAPALFRLRGTREGLWRQLLLLLNLDAATCCCPDDQPIATCSPKPLNCRTQAKVACAWQPPPLILEHFQLRRWLFLDRGRLGDQAVLWGSRIVNRSQLGRSAQLNVSQVVSTQDPDRDPFHVYAHRFTVFVPQNCGDTDAKKRSLLNLLNAEKPAHTDFSLEIVGPRFRIGFQSSIGLDSVVGRYPRGITLGQTVLGPASVVGQGPAAQTGPGMEIGRNARIGSTTELS